MHQKSFLEESLRKRDARREEAELAWKERQRELWCKEEELSPQTKEEINNVRTKLFWVYQTRDPKEFKVRFVTFLLWIIWESFGRTESTKYVKKNYDNNNNSFLVHCRFKILNIEDLYSGCFYLPFLYIYI
jgi:hypothetical protein